VLLLLVIHESVAGGMCFGYGDGSAARHETVDDSHLLISSGNSVKCASHEFNKEHVK
jgi:hypothetical protein